MKDNTLRESNAKVNRTVNELETITYYKHHYVRKTGLKKAIKALLAEEVRKVKIEELELILNGYGWGEGEEAANFIIKDRIAELEKDK